MSDYRIPVEIWYQIFDNILRVDFWEPIHELSYTWRERRRNYDLRERHEECWNRQGPLRLVSRRWKGLVEGYPCAWLQLRTKPRGMNKGSSMRLITSSYTHFHLEHGWTTSPTGVSDTNGITTLSVLLRDPSVISSLQRAINTLPTLPRLRALLVKVQGNLNDKCEVVSSVVFGLLRVVAGSLISFHLATAVTTIRGLPPVLPKLQRFRLEASHHFVSLIAVENWQLPSNQYMELETPVLMGDPTVLRKLATAFGAQLRSLAIIGGSSLTSNAFWEIFPNLTSLHVHTLRPEMVLPPIHHPMRELVLSWVLGEPRILFDVVLPCVCPAYQHPQASGLTVSRKVVLAGLKWTEDCTVMKKIMRSNVEWEKLAPHVEDMFGETLASARARFLKNNQGADEVKKSV
jgi:hypothetical protein